MLNVLITVDTEFWTNRPLTPAQTVRTVDRDVWGRTPTGDFGVGFQARTLENHGLKGVFHVEALCAGVVGHGPLREIVTEIESRGQEVQLHLHTEWLRRGAGPYPGRRAQHIRHLRVDEQTALLRHGAETLAACGARPIRAFRAGNFGASWDTLRAVGRAGLPFDTSYNHCYQGAGMDMAGAGHFLQPRRVHGVWEFPVTYIRDLPGHYRPVHVNACSLRETVHALEQALARGWRYFVIVSHSFELIDRRSRLPDAIAIRRWTRLCRYLAKHRDRFRVVGFNDLDEPRRELRPRRPLRSPAWWTARRFVAQGLRRLPAWGRPGADTLPHRRA